MLFICVQSDLRCYGACQHSLEPLGDAEQVQDGAQLERGDVLRACACEHSVSRESCCGRPYR